MSNQTLIRGNGDPAGRPRHDLGNGLAVLSDDQVGHAETGEATPREPQADGRKW